jgi:hypothetical protein
VTENTLVLAMRGMEGREGLRQGGAKIRDDRP